MLVVLQLYITMHDVRIFFQIIYLELLHLLFLKLHLTIDRLLLHVDSISLRCRVDDVNDLQHFVIELLFFDKTIDLGLDYWDVSHLSHGWSLRVLFVKQGGNQHLKVCIYILMERIVPTPRD